MVGLRVVFVHGALVFDGAWWRDRMVKPLAALGLGTRVVELPSCVAPQVPSVEAMGDTYADAVRTLAYYLVHERGYHRPGIDSTADNAGAIRTYEQVGFRTVRLMRGY